MVSLKGFKQWLQMSKQEMEIRNLAIGINSTVDLTADLHIVMLDFDIHDIDKIVESVDELQGFYRLSDAYIYRTKNGHHVFFWYDHVPYGRLKQIIEFAKHVDPMFKYISRFYDHKTIRVAGKYKHRDIQFVKKVTGGRSPTELELDRGTMKQEEHRSLLQVH
jgi:hypothetical protein